MTLSVPEPVALIEPPVLFASLGPVSPQELPALVTVFVSAMLSLPLLSTTPLRRAVWLKFIVPVLTTVPPLPLSRLAPVPESEETVKVPALVKVLPATLKPTPPLEPPLHSPGEAGQVRVIEPLLVKSPCRTALVLVLLALIVSPWFSCISPLRLKPPKTPTSLAPLPVYLRLPQGITTSSVVPSPCSKLIALRTPVPTPLILPPVSFLTNGSVPPQELPALVATAPLPTVMKPLLVT